MFPTLLRKRWRPHREWGTKGDVSWSSRQGKGHWRGIQHKYFGVIIKSEMLSHYLSCQPARRLSIKHSPGGIWHSSLRGLKKNKIKRDGLKATCVISKQKTNHYHWTDGRLRNKTAKQQALREAGGRRFVCAVKIHFWVPDKREISLPVTSEETWSWKRHQQATLGLAPQILTHQVCSPTKAKRDGSAS